MAPPTPERFLFLLFHLRLTIPMLLTLYQLQTLMTSQTTLYLSIVSTAKGGLLASRMRSLLVPEPQSFSLRSWTNLPTPACTRVSSAWMWGIAESVSRFLTNWGLRPSQ
jgi:hypothetical protein